MPPSAENPLPSFISPSATGFGGMAQGTISTRKCVSSLPEIELRCSPLADQSAHVARWQLATQCRPLTKELSKSALPNFHAAEREFGVNHRQQFQSGRNRFDVS
jgi:hypothetical protein